jgi:hypothetical protein
MTQPAPTVMCAGEARLLRIQIVASTWPDKSPARPCGFLTSRTSRQMTGLRGVDDGMKEVT